MVRGIRAAIRAQPWLTAATVVVVCAIQILAPPLRIRNHFETKISAATPPATARRKNPAATAAMSKIGTW